MKLPADAVIAKPKVANYGDKYRIVGALIGPNGRTLQVVSVWMIEAATRTTKFLTLYPAKET